MQLRCHHSIIDRPCTPKSRGREMVAVNTSPDPLSRERVALTAPGASSMRAMLRFSGLKFRFFASSIRDRRDLLDAGSISKSLNDLVSCIDAERAAI